MTGVRGSVGCAALALLMTGVVLGGQAPVPAIEASGGLDAATTWNGGEVSFWIRIRTRSDTALSQLRFQIVGNDLELVAICTPFERTDGSPCQRDPVVAIIPAGVERQLSGTLHARSSGQHRPTLQAMDGSGRAITIPLGSLTVDNRLWSVVDWLKDLAVAIVLAVFGYALNQKIKKEQNERKDREDAHAAERSRAAKELEERGASVRLMLPIVHQYGIRHYVDLAGAFQRFALHGQTYASNADNADKAGSLDVQDVSLQNAAFELIKAELIFREFYQQVGGLYLSTLIAEDILGTAFDSLHRSLLPQGHPGSVALTAMLDALQGPAPAQPTPLTPATFSAARMLVLNRVKFGQFLAGSDQAVRDAYAAITARLKDWLDSTEHEDGLGCAEIYANVLTHETNMALEQWYRDVPKFDVGKCRAVAERICEALEGEAATRARSYLRLSGPETRVAAQ